MASLECLGLGRGLSLVCSADSLFQVPPILESLFFFFLGGGGIYIFGAIFEHIHVFIFLRIQSKRKFRRTSPWWIKLTSHQSSAPAPQVVDRYDILKWPRQRNQEDEKDVGQIDTEDHYVNKINKVGIIRCLHRAMPIAMRKNQKRSWCRLGCLVVCCLAFALFPTEAPASHVGQTTRVQPQRGVVGLRTTMWVRERRGSLSRKTIDPKFQVSDDTDQEAKQLTSKIKKAKTAGLLLGVLEGAVDADYFNYYHASAAYHSLAMFHRKQTLPENFAEKATLSKLHRRVENMIKSNEINAQASANVLWAVAKLLMPCHFQLLCFLPWSTIFPRKLLA